MVRYDFLWDHEHRKGQTEGTKDRFCFVVIATKPQEDGSNRLLLAPITHTPPSSDDRAIDMPPKLGRHLGLDDNRSWIKTNATNAITCPPDRVPVGFFPTDRGEWVHGKLPQSMRADLIERVSDHARNQTMSRIEREDAPPLPVRPKPKPPEPSKPPRPSKAPPRPTLTLSSKAEGNRLHRPEQSEPPRPPKASPRPRRGNDPDRDPDRDR